MDNVWKDTKKEKPVLMGENKSISLVCLIRGGNPNDSGTYIDDTIRWDGKKFVDDDGYRVRDYQIVAWCYEEDLKKYVKAQIEE